jgi:hypothetical protein
MTRIFDHYQDRPEPADYDPYDRQTVIPEGLSEDEMVKFLITDFKKDTGIDLDEDDVRQALRITILEQRGGAYLNSLGRPLPDAAHERRR